jgi:hypothetical protein
MELRVPTHPDEDMGGQGKTHNFQLSLLQNSCHPERGAPGAESKDPPKLGETQ